jgi:hypothetical protein
MKSHQEKTIYSGGLEVTYFYDNFGFRTQTKTGDKTVYHLDYFDGKTSQSHFGGSFTTNEI